MKMSTKSFIIGSFISGLIFTIAFGVNHLFIMRSNIENLYLSAIIVSLQLIFLVCIIGSFHLYGSLKWGSLKRRLDEIDGEK